MFCNRNRHIEFDLSMSNRHVPTTTSQLLINIKQCPKHCISGGRIVVVLSWVRTVTTSRNKWRKLHHKKPIFVGRRSDVGANLKGKGKARLYSRTFSCWEIRIYTASLAICYPTHASHNLYSLGTGNVRISIFLDQISACWDVAFDAPYTSASSLLRCKAADTVHIKTGPIALVNEALVPASWWSWWWWYNDCLTSRLVPHLRPYNSAHPPFLTLSADSFHCALFSYTPEKDESSTGPSSPSQPTWAAPQSPSLPPPKSRFQVQILQVKSHNNNNNHLIRSTRDYLQFSIWYC